MRTAPRRQNGATLIVTLVMLIMLTLFAISAMNTSTTNLQVVGNMQFRQEGMRSSNEAIEATLSTTRFIDTPSDAVENPCGVQNTLCTDLNGDGVPDLTTRLTPPPACKQGRVIKIQELKILSPKSDDVACLQAQQQGTFAVAGAQMSGNSLCGFTMWEITAETLQTGTNTVTSDVNITTVQGVSVRVPSIKIEDKASGVCP